MSDSTIPKPQAYPAGLPKRVLSAVTQNTVLILGLIVLSVIVLEFVLLLFGSTLPDTIINLAAVALGILGQGFVSSSSPQQPSSSGDSNG